MAFLEDIKEEFLNTFPEEVRDNANTYALSN
jgi:hypothetical protein